MKQLLIHFKVGAYCAMELEVPNNYQISSTHPYEFWEDLCKKYPKQIGTDIVRCRDFGVEYQELDGFIIENMVLDHFQKVYISQDDKETIEINLEHIPHTYYKE